MLITRDATSRYKAGALRHGKAHRRAKVQLADNLVLWRQRAACPHAVGTTNVDPLHHSGNTLMCDACGATFTNATRKPLVKALYLYENHGLPYGAERIEARDRHIELLHACRHQGCRPREPIRDPADIFQVDWGVTGVVIRVALAQYGSPLVLPEGWVLKATRALRRT